jgi:hypothetical protein
VGKFCPDRNEYYNSTVKLQPYRKGKTKVSNLKRMGAEPVLGKGI